MGEPFGDLAVIGEHQHTGSVLVEPADREYPGAAFLEQVHHGLFGVRVACSRDITLRLVHHDVDLFLTADSLTVELDVVGEYVDLRAKLGDNLVVYSHDACLDILVSLAAGAYS